MSDLPYDFLSPHPPRRTPFAPFHHLQPTGLFQLKKDRIDPQRIRPASANQFSHGKPLRTRLDDAPDLLDIQGFIIHKEKCRAVRFVRPPRTTGHNKFTTVLTKRRSNRYQCFQFTQQKAYWLQQRANILFRKIKKIIIIPSYTILQ